MGIADSDEKFMRQALSLAHQAGKTAEVPVGAVVVLDEQVIGSGYNQPISTADPTAHAEIIALREACRGQANYRLPGATLYTTVEPCLMCVGALVHARVARVVCGALEPKAGALISHPVADSEWLNHRIEITHGVCAEECASLMSDFFAARRQQHITAESAVEVMNRKA